VAKHVASLVPHVQLEVLRGPGWPSDRAKADRDLRPFSEASQRFIGVGATRPGIDTVLSTVLFTDIVASTEHQSRLGDRAWKELVERHHATIRAALDAWRGVESG